jgi:hypothetical protein
MDLQIFFNVSVAIAGFLGGWILNNISRSINVLDKDVRAMPINYVTKEDYKGDISEIKGMLSEIYRELRNKADR